MKNIPFLSIDSYLYRLNAAVEHLFYRNAEQVLRSIPQDYDFIEIMFPTYVDELCIGEITLNLASLIDKPTILVPDSTIRCPTNLYIKANDYVQISRSEFSYGSITWDYLIVSAELRLYDYCNTTKMLKGYISKGRKFNIRKCLKDMGLKPELFSSLSIDPGAWVEFTRKLVDKARDVDWLEIEVQVNGTNRGYSCLSRLLYDLEVNS